MAAESPKKQTQYKPNTNPIKANFRKAKMNVNSLITKDYRKKDDFAIRKNKPNSKPISKARKCISLGNVADLSNDDSVNYTDMMLFTDKWLFEEVLLAEDLNRDGFVNFIDFAIFADNWHWEQ